MVITKVLVHFCPPYKILSLLVISFSLSLPARLSFYHFLSHLVSGNRIEKRQWIVARHLSCYNPLSCFTPFCGVKYDKIKLHDFFVFVIFSLSPLSLLLFLPCLSVSLSFSLSPAPLSLSFCLPSLSLCRLHSKYQIYKYILSYYNEYKSILSSRMQLRGQCLKRWKWSQIPIPLHPIIQFSFMFIVY